MNNYIVPENEIHRTRPDYITFIPKDIGKEGLNEHFIVFEGADNTLKAIWTQSDMASGLPDYEQVNRIMFTHSNDGGGTWATPKRIVGPKDKNDTSCDMASWAFPMVSDSGRIYVLYNQNNGKSNYQPMHTGIMCGLYSDDHGETWSAPEEVPFEFNQFDDPNRDIPPDWIVWQRPMKDLKGGFIAPYSRWLHKDVAKIKEKEIADKKATWTWWESVCEVMRFTNIQSNPEVKDIKISYTAWGDTALRAPHYLYPESSVAQEPSIIRLPDGSIFCAMRTNSGYLWYSVSKDDGETWCSPRPLLYKDFGLPILNPVGCAPIYQLMNGKYALFYSNNRGVIEPPAEWGPRNPVFLSIGEFMPDADQPLWFGKPYNFMDCKHLSIYGDENGINGISLYASFTTSTGKNILWYPDRKFSLLGKEITDEMINICLNT
ncbi:MAG: sialidase family protein [Terrimicrobiaceae bacterium]